MAVTATVSAVPAANKERSAVRPVLVGVDDGYAYTKIVVDGGLSLKIRSAVRPGMNALASMSGEGDMDGCYEFEGMRYTIGEGIEGENTRFDDYPGSTLNLVAIHHALRLAGLSGRDVKIATGLPVGSFYNREGRINRALIERKREGIRKQLQSIDGSKLAQVSDHIVCSEAVSAWLDYVLDEDGQPIKERDDGGTVGIVDIGGRTTDCVWICPPDKIDHEHSGTENVGVLNVFDDISAALGKKFNVEVSRRKLEVTMASKTLSLFSEKHDVTDIVDGAVANLAERIQREIQRRFGDAADLEHIIFVGGGAALMPQIGQHFKHGHVPDQPEFANARGMLKFMKHRG